ncbi:hypothetical protein KXD93_15410 [Mucilaginibacter sp. BJC16-A38]|uniref:hypothetical protein n=1 Tax=Mucilaginibacter phenanthrenivorans TaxID=1234842 RepID=UPI002157BF39|nr:hypothetical protein [Mucilaginibacter phenanthrenivorans]MCR8559044.1 hypothetical protein [Mucilaginibacter phenanthrenivorans]
MEEYKNKLGSLANKLKTDTPKIPIQEVHPVKAPANNKEDEAQLNTWIPKSLLKRMKSFGVDEDLSLKDINILALTFFLDAKAPQVELKMENQ